MGLFESSRGPIGLQVGNRVIRAMQLTGQGQERRVLSMARAVLPAQTPASGVEHDQAVASAVKEVLAQGRFVGRQVVSALPSQLVHYKNLRLPRMPEEELAAAVTWEASDRLQMPAQDTIVQYLNVGEVHQGEDVRQEVILMAVPRRDIDLHAQMLMDCGLQPVAVDALPAALARALVPQAQKPTEQNAEGASRFILDVGYTTCKVLIVKNDQVMFFKPIALAGRKWDEALSAKLGLTAQEARDMRRNLVAQQSAGSLDPILGSTRRANIEHAAIEALRPIFTELVTEIGLCLRYYSVTFRGRRPESVIMTGCEADEPHLKKCLTEELHLKLVPARPFEGLSFATAPAWAADEPDNHGSWAVALGLALRPMASRSWLRRAA